MDVLKIFDAYSLRARLFPAIIAAAPAIAALALLISWKSLGLSNALATIGTLVLLFAIADLARWRGRAIERKLYSEHAGVPSITMFRKNDPVIDRGSKERYRTFLAGKLGVSVPSPDEDEKNPSGADAFYEQCGVWLRQNTRDTKKFSLLFTENVTYGFRRNLLGIKTLALGLNLFVVVICVVLLWRTSWLLETGQGKRVAVVLIIAAAHAAYMLLAVRKANVWDAAQTYGRELILSCEGFHSTTGVREKKVTTRKNSPRKSTKNANGSYP